MRDYLVVEAAERVQTLFVISTLPLVHTARWAVEPVSRLPGRLGRPARGGWNSGDFLDERDALLEELFAWQAAAPHRRVILLSGDVEASLRTAGRILVTPDDRTPGDADGSG
jgi:hypothetical protein